MQQFTLNYQIDILKCALLAVIPVGAAASLTLKLLLEVFGSAVKFLVTVWLMFLAR